MLEFCMMGGDGEQMGWKSLSHKNYALPQIEIYWISDRQKREGSVCLCCDG